MPEPRLLRSQLSCQFQRTSDKPQGHQGTALCGTAHLKSKLPYTGVGEETACAWDPVGSGRHAKHLCGPSFVCGDSRQSPLRKWPSTLLDSTKHLTPDFCGNGSAQCSSHQRSVEHRACLTLSRAKALRCKLEPTGSRKQKQGTYSCFFYVLQQTRGITHILGPQPKRSAVTDS